MELEIRPQPPDPVRRAIEAAVASAATEQESAWWRAGIDELLDDDAPGSRGGAAPE